MKYFLDTEFHEYKKQPKVLGFNVGKPIDTIELISIGIVSEDFPIAKITKSYPADNEVGYESREEIISSSCKKYYAICKDFDLKAAWDNEWLRENVLYSIWHELMYEEIYSSDRVTSYFKILGEYDHVVTKTNTVHNRDWFNLTELKLLLNKYGKTREQVAEEIYDFVYKAQELSKSDRTGAVKSSTVMNDVEFYAYYADYDWVVFCWLFGKRIDLPKGFPMYCSDLKQMLNEKVSDMDFKESTSIREGDTKIIKGSSNLELFLKHVEGEGLKNGTYPKQSNKHNALADAKWNKELYKFIETL